MERVRLPLEYTVRQSGARGPLMSHFYRWEDLGMPSSPSQRGEGFHQMVWSGANAPADRKTSTFAVSQTGKQTSTPSPVFKPGSSYE